MKKYGVAIPLLAHGFKSAKDIIDEHIAVQVKNNDKECIFSTDYLFDPFKLKELSSIIFYSKAENLYFEADIIQTYLNEPPISKTLSPHDYIGVEKKAWFHIRNIRPFQLEDKINYIRENKKSLPHQIMTSKRPNKFYYEIKL